MDYTVCHNKRKMSEGLNYSIILWQSCKILGKKLDQRVMLGWWRGLTNKIRNLGCVICLENLEYILQLIFRNFFTKTNIFLTGLGSRSHEFIYDCVYQYEGKEILCQILGISFTFIPKFRMLYEWLLINTIIGEFMRPTA